MQESQMEVSCFPNIKTTANPKQLPISIVLNGIKAGTWKAKQERVRKLKAIWNADPENKAKKNAYKKAKGDMPYVTASGTYTQRNNDSLIQHSGVLQVDLDGDDNPGWTPEKMRKVVAADPYTYSAGISLSGDGVKAFALIPPDPKQHLASFHAIKDHFRNEYGLNMDDATKDISRPCFVWYDPDLVINDIDGVKVVEPQKNEPPLIFNGDGTSAPPTPPMLTSANQIDPITIADTRSFYSLQDATEALRRIKEGLGRPEYDDRLRILSGMYNSYGQAGYDAVQAVFGTDGFDKPIKHLTERHTAGSVFFMAQQISEPSTIQQAPETDRDAFLAALSAMVTTPEHIRKMEEQAREAVFILPRIACAGDLTIINARFSTGKTLLTLWLLSQRNREQCSGMKIYYINADDSFNGSIEKAALANSIGVQTLIPGQAGFDNDKLRWILQSAIDSDSAGGVVIILDTLKKFVDTMDKKEARAINLLLRNFAMAGGTVIALAHTNKHKIAGESVAEGVGDFLSDFDCAYLLETVEPTPDNVKTVVFKNQKLRNPNAKEVHFTYDDSEGKTWHERFDSVEIVESERAKSMLADSEAEQRHQEDMPVIIYLEKRIYGATEPISSTALCQHDLDGDTPSRGQRERVLSLYSDANPRELHRHWRQRKMENKKGKFYTPPEKMEPF